MAHVRAKLSVSKRRACLALRQHRSTQRYAADPRDDEEALTAAVIALATQYGRYGYRRILELLHRGGWQLGHTRLERIWRREGLQVPSKQSNRRRLWLSDGSCIRLRPCWPSHVWSYDFVMARTHDGKAFRMLTIIDEFTRECSAIDVARKLKSEDVLYRLGRLFVKRGVPDHIRSDNGPEFTATAVREWLRRVGEWQRLTLNVVQTDRAGHVCALLLVLTGCAAKPNTPQQRAYDMAYMECEALAAQITGPVLRHLVLG